METGKIRSDKFNVRAENPPTYKPISGKYLTDALEYSFLNWMPLGIGILV